MEKMKGLMRKLKKKREEDGSNSYSSLMEEMFSFIPKVRKGKTANRREERIRDKNARLLYDRRIGISKSIVEAGFDDIVKDSSQALLYNKLSPETYAGWTSHLRNIAMREGGWDFVKKQLSNELSIIDSAKMNAIHSAMMSFLILLFFTIIRIGLSPHTPDIFDTIIYIIGMSTFMIHFIVFTFTTIEKTIKIRAIYSGQKHKELSDFTKYEKAMMGSW